MSGWRALVLVLAFGLASLALARAIWSDLASPPDLDLSAPARAPAASGEAGNLAPPPLAEHAPPPLTEFSAAFERPLFDPDRRPPAAEPAGPAPEPVRPARLEAVLKGVVLSRERGMALVAEDAAAPPVPVAVGERFRGWRLVAIDPGQAVFERDGQQVTLVLSYRDRTPPR